MGLFKFLGQIKDEFKATMQMYEEAEAEAKEWKTFDPKMLKAILDGKPERAAEIYTKTTGASTEKAEAVVNNISDIVKDQYPAILRAQAHEADMQSIKKVWPFGAKPFYVFAFPNEKNKKKTILVLSGQLKSKGRGKYSFSIEGLYFKPFKFNAIIKNNRLSRYSSRHHPQCQQCQKPLDNFSIFHIFQI